MANARTVKEVPISGKTRTKTSIFWSTVPEKEQFRNVHVPGVPGVALDRLKDVKKNTQSQKYAQVVQKSKSDSAILNTRSDSVNKQRTTGHKFAVKQNDHSDKKSDAPSIIKGASTASSDQFANMSILSESTKARRASLKNLNVEDKKRVANLIKELAKTGEEREFALERLQEERVSFDEQLSAVQEEQKALKLEREALKQRLEKSEKLLKKYESELKDVKTEKEEQEKILKKKFHVQPQSTQTSPLIQNFSTDGTTKSGRFISEQGDTQPRGTKKTLSTQAYIGDSNDRDGRRQWSKPQVPVYSNSLFDVKVSNVDHSETRSVSEEYQRSSIMENGGLHELYLREYSLQLRLQEQQIEIQRQQVQLQQQLQLLQQQQQQPQLAKQDQYHQEQQNNERQRLTQRHEKHNEQHSYEQRQEQNVHHQPVEYKQKHSNADHKHQKQEWQKQTTQQTRHSRELQPLNQPLNWQQQDPQYPNEQRIEEIFKQSSPTQQTNLLQKRTPERKGQQVEAKRADTNRTADHTDHSPRPRHDHHHSVVENSRQRYEDVFDGQNGEPQKKDRSYTSSGSPSRHYFHHSGHDVEKNRFAVEHQTNRNKGQHGTDGTSFKKRHMSKGKSPRKHVDANAKQIDNNNEYFNPKSYGQQKNRYDIDDNLVHDRYPQEYLSESYIETDDDLAKHHYSSERPCHCGYYHNHVQRQPVTLDYGQLMSNHSHSRSIPKHAPKSQYGITENPYQKGEPNHAQIYQQPHRQQHSPDNSYRQRLLHDPMHTRVPEHIPSSGHHLHKGEYHHSPDIREEHHTVPHHGAPHYVTQQESEYVVNTIQPAERRTYTRHQLRSPTGVLLSPQVGKTEHDHLSSEGLQHSRSQVNRDRSKYLLDDYIYNHHTQNNTKSNAGYEPRDTSNKHSFKRKISRKSHGNVEMERKENDHPAMLSMTSQQIQYEDENPNPSYSLYKQTLPHLTREQPEYPKTPPGRKRDSRKRYPNSLVEIVEDLETNSEYEEKYSEETEMYSTEEPGYDSDEEESTVLDNIFFLKR